MRAARSLAPRMAAETLPARSLSPDVCLAAGADRFGTPSGESGQWRAGRHPRYVPLRAALTPRRR